MRYGAGGRLRAIVLRGGPEGVAPGTTSVVAQGPSPAAGIQPPEPVLPPTLSLPRDQVLRRALSTSLRRNESGSLGAFLQGPGALEMLEYLAAHSPEPSLQKKATMLLDQLRPLVPSLAPGG